MKYFFVYVLFFFATNVHAQYSFEYVISNAQAEIPVAAVEKEDGNYFIAVQSDPFELSIALIIELSSEGELMQSVEVPHSDTLRYFPRYLEERGDTLLMLGSAVHRDSSLFYPWYCTVYSDDMSLITSKVLWGSAPFTTLTGGIDKISQNRYVLTGYRRDMYAFWDGYVSIVSNKGELLDYAIHPADSSQIPTAVLEKSDSTGFILKGLTGAYVLLDNDLEVDSVINYPFGYEAVLMQESVLKRLDDSTYFLSGLHHFLGSNEEEDIGIKKIRHTNEVIAEHRFGKPDTTETTALKQSLDFIYPDKIYCGGWQRNGLSFISELPGWLSLSQYDEDLNLNWTRYYGGDAFYIMEGVLATQDGGCLIYSRRYAFTGDYNYDIHLLKVGPDGLLTSTTTPENTPNITVYPNPTSNYIFFDTGEAGMYDVSFFDGLGKVIFQEKILNNRPVDVRHLPAGIYTYVLERKGEIVSQGKWVKE